MEDKELFELCKEVYERTGWYEQYADNIPQELPPVPLYTSDYLLERLPKQLNGAYLNLSSTGILSENMWTAFYSLPFTKSYAESDTPIKSLLKVTIDLHEAGELK